MSTRSLSRILKLGFQNFWRNRWISLTAILIITLTLTTLSAFLIVSVFTNVASEKLKSKVDVTVNFKDSAPESIIQDFQRQVAQNADITVTYISKEEALRIFKSRTMVRQNIRELVTDENNPLPRGLRIKANDLLFLDTVNQMVKSSKYAAYIDSSNYEDNKVIIEKIDNATRFVRRVGILASAFFILISILVILNAVRLAVFSRYEEIEIMRLVGATESYVRTPFLVEGALYGLVAVFISMGLIILGVFYFAQVLAGYFVDFEINLLRFFTDRLWQVIVLEIVVAIFLCVVCSWLSVRKYIKI